MAISQQDRIAISKKMVQIPFENKNTDNTIATIQKVKTPLQQQDTANKNLMDNVSTYINGYQSELQRYDGNGRIILTEQNLLDAVNRTVSNFFFPNTPNTPLPSLPSGVWTNFQAFANTAALGKTYNEVYTTITKEANLINAILSEAAIMNAFTAVGRSTGQYCNPSGTCSIPTYTTLATCNANSGIWTPGPDAITNDPVIQTSATNLINAIQAWETFIAGTDAAVMTTDTNPTRSAQNVASRADIANTTSIINSWQALATFYTGHGQTSCAGFSAINVNTLIPTKFRSAEFSAITNEITARLAFITTRSSQLNTSLGTVTQDLTTGNVISATGFYGTRYLFIDTRINATTGSLTQFMSADRGISAQNKIKTSNTQSLTAYQSMITATIFVAPSIGTSTVHVDNASGFAALDNVYVVADDQEEISAQIVSISGNSIKLDKDIPQKYRQDAFARVYKVL